MEEKIYGVYSNEADITFIMKDCFYTNDCISTEVVGFIFGNYENDEEVLNLHIGNLKAEFQPLTLVREVS